MARLLWGTCSWTDPTLLRSGWYPPEVRSAEKRLEHYASRFPLVEVDATYYALPAEATARLWVSRTPPGFIYGVKAFSLFTGHPTPVKALPKDLRPLVGKETGNVYYPRAPQELLQELWRRFEDALLPLDSAGKLGAVLFQFPEWFFPGADSWEHILKCRESLPQFRLAIEFRNAAWLSEGNRERTLGFLRESGLSYVCVDEPQGFRSSVPPVAEVTADLSLVRFHGRNRETWEKKGITVAERFKYLYTREELGEWLPRIKHLAEKAREVHLLFNNCYADYGVKNAQDLADLLRHQLPLLRDLVVEAGSV